MSQLLGFNKFRRSGALILVFASAIVLSSCAKMPNLMPKDAGAAKATGEAAEQVKSARTEDKKAHVEEAKELKKERMEEKTEDKEFALMKKQLEEDAARAAANSDNPDVVSRVFFDKEILALNERIHILSKRVEDLSERTHHMAQRLEHDPLKIAELELAVKSIEAKIGSDGVERKAPRHGMAKKSPQMSGKPCRSRDHQAAYGSYAVPGRKSSRNLLSLTKC